MERFPMKKITSLTHPLVKHLCKLRTNKTYRQEQQRVIVPGHKLISELSRYHHPHHILFCEKTPPPITQDPCEHLMVSQEIIKKISGLKNPEPIVASFTIPKEAPLVNKKYLLALDRINDPGNLGTLLRTAFALGWCGCFLLPETVDPFHEKALRASRGASFYLPHRFISWEDLMQFSEKHNMPLLAADVNGTHPEKLLQHSKMILVLSHEAQGTRPSLPKRTQKVSIPIHPDMESLNVAIAGGILMYLLQKK